MRARPILIEPFDTRQTIARPEEDEDETVDRRNPSSVKKPVYARIIYVRTMRAALIMAWLQPVHSQEVGYIYATVLVVTSKTLH
jgi:hypothetical protein